MVNTLSVFLQVSVWERCHRLKTEYNKKGRLILYLYRRAGALIQTSTQADGNIFHSLFSAWSASLSSSHESGDMFSKRANSKASLCCMSSLKSDVFLAVSQVCWKLAALVGSSEQPVNSCSCQWGSCGCPRDTPVNTVGASDPVFQ